MKNLHEHTEERWQFNTLGVMDGVVRAPQSPQQVILLLHGLLERGRRIYRKLLPFLPANALVLAPNGPFPIPRQKENRLDFGHAWYFYDRFEKKYFINQDLPRSWLKELLRIKNPDKLPVTVIGFSQGGYLAPLIGGDVPETKLVIGIGCEFRSVLIKKNLHFPLEGIHGAKDEAISPLSAEREIGLLRERGMKCGWHLVPEAAHEITAEMGTIVKQLLEEHGKRSL